MGRGRSRRKRVAAIGLRVGVADVSWPILFRVEMLEKAIADLEAER